MKRKQGILWLWLRERGFLGNFLQIILLAVTAVCGGIFFTQSTYATSYINVSSSAPDGMVNFDKVYPSSAGEMATAHDTLTINTNCLAGYNVYVSGTSSGSTNLVNDSAADSGNNIIPTSSTSIGGTAAALLADTWGITASSSDVSDGKYFGLPAYSSAVSNALVTKSDVETSSTVPIYYGAKISTNVAPGTYNGDILYTVLVNSSCQDYIVTFDKNASDATGTMDNQSIPVGDATILSANAYKRTGYAFVGWSNSSNGKTGTATNGVGTTADVDYKDEAEVIDIASGGQIKTLYAIWLPIAGDMQTYDCANITPGTTVNLRDIRDEQIYTIYRWPSTGTAGTNYPTGMPGTCIMTKDLSLGYVTGGSVTKGANLSLSTSTSAGSGIITARTGASDWSGDNNDSNLQYINGSQSGKEDYSSHSYYTYGAAQMVCPKGWRLPTNTEYSNIATFMGGDNSTGSSKMRGDPYSFVYGGSFASSEWSNVGSYGNYWSSVQYSSTDGYNSYFGSSILRTSYGYKSNGFSVRCVAGPLTISGLTYMQDITPQIVGDTATNAYAQLTDKRDNNKYYVKKLKDGNLWMAENLRLVGSRTLTSEDSNVSSNFTLTANAGKSGWCTDSNSTCINKSMVYYESSRSSYGALYNWYAATAGTGTYATTSGNASSSICPKGWRLPTGGGDVSTNEFSILDIALGGDGTYRTNANTYSTFTGTYTSGDNGGFAPLPGIINNGSLSLIGSYGHWWSSTANSSDHTYYLDLYSGNPYDSAQTSLSPGDTYVYPQNHYYKFRGQSVRCVASRGDYTVSYSGGASFSGSPSKPSDVVYKTDSFTTAGQGTLSRDGHDFLGWSLSPTATTVTYAANTTVNVQTLVSAAGSPALGATITLYAVWAILDDGNLGSMQSFNCTSLTPNHVATVTDSRDNQAYSIYRWSSTGTAGTNYPTSMAGYCIMTKDLSLGYVTGGSVTKGANLSLSTTTSAGSGTVIARASGGSWNQENVGSNLQYINGPASGAKEYTSHSYYSWPAAQKVCPKGWRLPTQSESNSIVAYSADGYLPGAVSYKMRSAPYSFLFGGYYEASGWQNVGTYGLYWLSTQSSSTQGYYLSIDDRHTYTLDGGTKSGAMSVRCISN